MCTPPAAPLLGDALWDTLALVPQIVEQLVPGLYLVDESVVAPKTVRVNKIQDPTEEHTSAHSRSAGGGGTSRNAVPGQAVSDARRKVEREETWQRQVAFAQKNRQSLLYDAEEEHCGNYRLFPRAQRP